MTKFNHRKTHRSEFHMRVTLAAGFVLFCFGLLALRLGYVQVWQHQKYALQAQRNRVSIVPIVPTRGVITDRNGVVLAKNYAAYTLEITPTQLTQSVNQTINQLSQLVNITPNDIRRFKRFREDIGRFDSVPIKMHLTDAEVARFTAQRYRFPGVEVKARLFREYPLGSTMANVIGYVGRISRHDQGYIEKLSERNDVDHDDYDPRLNKDNYNGTNYIGKTAIEQSYEAQLHGLTGYQEVEVTAGGRPVRVLSSKPAVSGDNLVLSIDAGLQVVAQKAFEGKKGALVAIDPKTGGILAFVSAPSFDPNLFVDGIDQKTWDQLNTDPHKPLLNRPLHGTYPPGSTYKPFMALAGLMLKARTPEQRYFDPGYWMLGNHRFNNDVRTGQGWVDMRRAIAISNDTYFYILAYELGVNAIAKFMKPFGFGEPTGIDIFGEAKGILPTKEWKKQMFKTPAQKRWYDGDTVSLGIGQGYNTFTTLQLAHAVSILANGGVIMRPHLVKEVVNTTTQKYQLIDPKEIGRIAIPPEDLKVVIDGMTDVTTSGTASRVFHGEPYLVAGKTGTAQVFSLGGAKYDSRNLAKHLHDHALFIAFAPANDPKIALAVVVENGGWGASVAAPIARQVIDFYLQKRQKPGVEAKLIKEAEQQTKPIEIPIVGDKARSQIKMMPGFELPEFLKQMHLPVTMVSPTSLINLESNAQAVSVDDDTPAVLQDDVLINAQGQTPFAPENTFQSSNDVMPRKEESTSAKP